MYLCKSCMSIHAKSSHQTAALIDTEKKQCHLICTELVNSYNFLFYSPTFYGMTTQKTTAVQIPHFSDCILPSPAFIQMHNVPRRLMDVSSLGQGNSGAGERLSNKG